MDIVFVMIMNPLLSQLGQNISRFLA